MASEEQKSETKVHNTNKQKSKDNPDSKDPKNRKEVKAAKKKEKQEGKKPGFFKRRIRFIPVWLRVVLVIALAYFAFMWGLEVGYTILGDGEDPEVVKNRDFWEKLWDYIKGR